MITARIRATGTQQRLLLPSIIQLRRHESTTTTLQQEQDEESRRTATLVFLRHGQSTWNETPTFTGWCDPELTTRGKSEAIAAGQLLHRRGFTLHGFDRVYTSALHRAIETTELVLDQLDIGNDDNNTDSKKQKFDSIIKAWQLNERHYGALQGLRKDDAKLLEKYGKEQIAKWRRDFYATPPPSTMPTTHAHTNHFQGGGPTLTQPTKNVPLTESLQDCQTRVLAYWHTTIVPDLFQSNNEHSPTALLVGHANTLRALVSYLDNVPTDKIPHIHIPNSIPCIYHVNQYGRAALLDDEPTRPSVQHANGKYGETHGLWMLSAENYRRLQDKIGGSSGTFLHALFDAWDTNRDGVLSREEIRNGLRELKGDDDVVTAALAAKLLEEIDLDNSDTIDLLEFDSKAATAFQKFVPDLLLEST